MADRYKLSYTAEQIDERLGRIDELATKDYVVAKVAEAQLDGEVDLSIYATTEYVDNSLTNYATTNYVDAAIGNTSGITDELKLALISYFINIQTLLTQVAFATNAHNAGIVISNAQQIIKALENSGSEVKPEQPEQPENGIIQIGSILAITSGVSANKTGTTLILT